MRRACDFSRMSQAVERSAFGIFRCDQLRKINNNFRLLPGRIVLKLSVDDSSTRAIRHGCDNLARKGNVRGIGAEHGLGDADLRGM